MLPIKTILHPTDFSDFSRAGFQLACSLAKDYNARLIVIHVEPPIEIIHGGFYGAPVAIKEDIEKTKEKLFELKPHDRTIEVDHFIVRGETGEVILQFADEHRADLIVMGTHGRSGLGRVLMGSVAEHVLRHSKCPVVTVKRPFGVDETGKDETSAVASTN